MAGSVDAQPSTTISYQMPRAGDVRLVVYDLHGREVVRLVDGQKPAGFYTATFNAAHFSSGVYIYRLSAAGFSAQRSMIFLK